MYTLYEDPTLITTFTLGEDLGWGSTSRTFGFGVKQFFVGPTRSTPRHQGACLSSK